MVCGGVSSRFRTQRTELGACRRPIDLLRPSPEPSRRELRDGELASTSAASTPPTTVLAPAKCG